MNRTRYTDIHLIEAKLMVPDLWPPLSRDRLLRMLEESVDTGTSTLLTGRSGTGKSMLAVDFTRRTGRRIAWVDLDAADAEPRIFFAYLIRAIERHRPGFGNLLEAFANVTDADDMGTVANVLVYSMLETPGPPVLLVLDNLHRLYDTAWASSFLVRLLPLLPFDTHLLMMGRGLPPAPLWRVRSKQTLRILEESTLAFTLGEVRELLHYYHGDPASAQGVLDLTHGRAALVESAIRDGPGSGSIFGWMHRLQVEQ
jgi:ATP/maltotriose-dependent transcriptional regulator MalT